MTTNATPPLRELLARPDIRWIRVSFVAAVLLMTLVLIVASATGHYLPGRGIAMMGFGWFIVFVLAVLRIRDWLLLV